MKIVEATIGYFVKVNIEVPDTTSDDTIREALCNHADAALKELVTNGEFEPVIHECDDYPELVD